MPFLECYNSIEIHINYSMVNIWQNLYSQYDILTLEKIMELAHLEDVHRGKNYTINSNNLIYFV